MTPPPGSKEPSPGAESRASKDADHINVTIRVRPLNQRELAQPTTGDAWTIQKDTITQVRRQGGSRPSIGNSYTFDHVFDPLQTTAEVFDSVAQDIISSTMDGFNGTIFAYGQTSSGKTHTMYGSAEEPGVIGLSIRRIFEHIEQTPNREYLLRVSFLEIYNEAIKDLLNPDNHHLRIHEHPTKGIFIGNLTENIVMSAHDVEQLLDQGDLNRHVGETNMNDRSSRSHTIFRMVIESRERPSDDKAEDPAPAYSGAVKVSCLNLVDLAGSERVAHTGAEGARLREGAHINKSLLALGTVIAKLTETEHDRASVHIPYRDSKLTRILEPSLGGNAKTAIICTVTPASTHVEETISTLKFASRAKNVCNKPEINEQLSGEALLRVYHKEISMLKKKLDEYRTMNGTQEIEKLTHQKMQIEEVNEVIRRQLREKESEETRLRKHYEELKMMIIDSSRLCNPEPAPSRVNRRQTWFPGTRGDLTQYRPTPALESSPPRPMTPIDQARDDGQAYSIGSTRRGRKRRASEMDGDCMIDQLPISKHQNTFATIVEQQKTIAALHDEIQTVQQQSETDRQQLMSLADKNHTLVQGIQTLIKAQDLTASSAPTAVPAELHALRQYLANYQQALSASKQALKHRTKRLCQDGDFHALELQASQLAYNDLQGQFEQERSTLNQALATLTAKFDELESRSKLEVELLSEQLAGYKAKLAQRDAVTGEIQSTQQALAEAEERIAALTDDLAKLQSSRATGDELHAAELATKADELAQYQAQAHDYETKLATLHEDYLRTKNAARSCQASLQELYPVLVDLTACNSDFHAYSKRAIAEGQQLVVEFKQLLANERHNAALVAQAKQGLQDELIAAQAQIVDLQRQLHRTTTDNAAMVQAHAQNAKRYQEALTSLRQAYTKLQDEFSLEQARLEAAVADAEDAMGDQASALRDQLAKVTEQFTAHLATVEAAIGTHKAQLADANAATETQKHETVRLQELLDATTATLDQVQSELTITNQRCRQLEQESHEQLSVRDATISELEQSLRVEKAAHQAQCEVNETLQRKVATVETAMVDCESQLMAKLSALVAESERLENELAELWTEYEALEGQMDTAEASDDQNTLADKDTVAELVLPDAIKDQLADLEEQALVATNALDEVRTQNGQLRHELEQSVQEKEQAMEKLFELAQTRDSLTTEHTQALDHARHQVQELETSLLATTAKLEELQGTHAALETELAKAREAWAAEQLQIQSQHATTEQTQQRASQAQAEAETKISQLESTLSALQAEAAGHQDAQAQLRTLQTQLDATTTELETARRQLLATEQAHHALQQQHEAQSVEPDPTSAARVTELEQQVQEWESQLGQALVALEAAQRELEIKEQEVTIAQQAAQTLADEMQAYEAASSNQVAHVQASLKDTQSALAASQLERQELVMALGRLQGKVVSLLSRITHLTAFSSNVQAQSESLVATGEATQLQNQRLSQTHTALQDQLTRLTTQWQMERDQLTTAAQDQTQQLTSAQALADQLQDQISKLQQQLAVTIQAHESTQKLLGDLQATHADTLATHNARVEALEAELHAVQSSLQTDAQAQGVLESRIQQLESDLVAARNDHQAALATAQANFDQATDDWKAQTARYQTQVAEADCIAKDHAAQVTQLTADLAARAQQLAEQEQALKQLQAAKVDASTQLFEQQEKVVALKQTGRELTKQLADLKSNDAIRQEQVEFQKSELDKWKLAYKHEQKKARKLADQYDHRLKELQAALESKQQQLDELQQLLHQRESEAEASHRQLARAENEAATKQSDPSPAWDDDALADRDTLTATYKQEIASLERENQRLKQEYRTCVLAKNNEITKSRQLSASIHQLQSENDRMRKELERQVLNGKGTKTPLKPSAHANGAADDVMAKTQAPPAKRVTRSMAARLATDASGNPPKGEVDENGQQKAAALARTTRSTQRRRRLVTANGPDVPVEGGDCKQQ
ncbi:hypothetical protein H4R34_001562 [Dimargaris verticillata]|uniref:Kinesin motor domain-containing protein n=1 Tax=Dimargaris verticillata TaxID=2761393 RepID=A0A9W8BB58_9FUNG|nr:hypothetical protein H4R34_001562 [Dimargaris verticillata]